MIVKPQGDEAESRYVALAERASAGGQAIREVGETGRRVVRKALKWYLIAIFGFGFFMSLLTLGFPGMVAAGLIGFAIWKWRNK